MLVRREGVNRNWPARFWSKVRKTRTCWLWVAAKNTQGRGQVVYNGKLEQAHRVSWILHNGAIPDGLAILHRCDVGHCVRPSHLFLGTQLDNIRDCVVKGRHPNSKLSVGKVKAVLALVESGTRWLDIARKFGVKRDVVKAIVEKRIWRDVS